MFLIKFSFIFLFIIFAAGQISAMDGKSVFTLKGCVNCHSLTQDRAASGYGPSLMQIKKAYNNDSAALTSFLKGETKKARIYPEKYSVMINPLNILKNLPDADLDALVKFLLTL
jgi:cytochrome c551/c552